MPGMYPTMQTGSQAHPYPASIGFRNGTAGESTRNRRLLWRNLCTGLEEADAKFVGELTTLLLSEGLLSSAHL